MLFIKNKKSTSVSYQSSSPDEVGIVKFLLLILPLVCRLL